MNDAHFCRKLLSQTVRNSGGVDGRRSNFSPASVAQGLDSCEKLGQYMLLSPHAVSHFFIKETLFAAEPPSYIQKVDLQANLPPDSDRSPTKKSSSRVHRCCSASPDAPFGSLAPWVLSGLPCTSRLSILQMLLRFQAAPASTFGRLTCKICQASPNARPW